MTWLFSYASCLIRFTTSKSGLSLAGATLGTNNVAAMRTKTKRVTVTGYQRAAVALRPGRHWKAEPGERFVDLGLTTGRAISKLPILGIVRLLTLSLTAVLSSALLCGETYNVYYLGGQSNMDGYGTVGELPTKLTGVLPSTYIFHGNPAPDGVPGGGAGIWAQLRPGHGADFQSDGSANQYSGRFGVELTLARRLAELAPDRKVALVKYSRGGTSIDERAARWFGSWEADFLNGPQQYSGLNQYDHFLATLRGAFGQRDIDGDGEADTLVPAGIAWMQGESDAGSKAVAESYLHNLKRLMDLVRAALRVDDLPVVIGRISDSGQDRDGRVWNYGDVVRQAQRDFVDSDQAAELVESTDDYGYSDPYHYDSAGYLDLGRRFAEALHRMAR